ncbi:MAG: hypothetical protein HYS81_02715 [Candidatus Aenigmatarchaeota archaeon]|nr:MAG: hypothetical protein HYS81_02715 [Candidatus Aenigmarchaeota archaeon]
MKGLSPVIAAVFVLAISLAAIVIVLKVGIPSFTEAREFATLTEAKGVLLAIDSAIREVASEGEGSTRRLQLRITDGTYVIDNKSQEVRFELQTESEIVAPCVGVREGPILINSGGDVTGAERDENNDGITDLILENSKMMLVINKTGTSASLAAVDTGKLILKMWIKGPNVNVTPSDSTIRLDNVANSNRGSGYTELLDSGTKMGRGRIRAHLENAGGIDYDVIYNLFCGDYVRIDVQNAVYR